MFGSREEAQAGTRTRAIPSSLSRQEQSLSIKATIPAARRKCTQRAWRLLTPVVTTRTSFETKAPRWHKSSPSASFRQVSRAASTLQTRETAPSNRDGRFDAIARGPSTRALASSHVDDQRSAFVAISTRKAGEEN